MIFDLHLSCQFLVLFKYCYISQPLYFTRHLRSSPFLWCFVQRNTQMCWYRLTRELQLYYNLHTTKSTLIVYMISYGSYYWCMMINLITLFFSTLFFTSKVKRNRIFFSFYKMAITRNFIIMCNTNKVSLTLNGSLRRVEKKY